MPQESKEKQRKFEQKLRDQGSDGFADGPRPWERWDESGHQANNRIWEGSAKRIYPRRRKTHSLGYRLLSVLALLALTTLLVGIGGVYFSHTQTQRLAQSEVQPLPATSPPVPSATPADREAVITADASQSHDLNVLSAPAAGSGATQEQALAAIETAAAVDAAIPATDEPMTTGTVETLAMAPEANPPATNESIDSVSIETIVTEKSVTTTVYTRHPQQAEAEIVAAIETLPPPFATGVVAAAQQAPDAEHPTVYISDDEAMSAAASTMPLPVLQAVAPDDAVTETADERLAAATDEDQLDMPADTPATAAAGENTAIELTEPGGETTVTGSLEESTAETAAEPIESTPDIAPADQTEDATAVAAAEVSSTVAVPESLEESVPEVSAEQRDALPDNQVTGQAEDATVIATTEADTATAVPEVNEEQSNISVAALTPVAKTGGWVINLASYTWKSTASRKLALFQQQGVDAEIFAVTINDKPMYRIRVTGYENSREAKAGIPALEETLDLEGAWISRR